jgi:hypothetical protein
MPAQPRGSSYDDAVFINCPFDLDYQPLFRALIFATYDCGFAAHSALEVEDAGEVRIHKINRLIRRCRHGIHDISRTEPDVKHGLPRFNMPLELGLFLGAREFGTGNQKRKRTLILDREPYRYQTYCSDIAGQDIKAHHGDPDAAIRAVRDWLANFRSLENPNLFLPGATRMTKRYHHFQSDLPVMSATLHIEPPELRFLELCKLVEEWVDENPPS